MANKMNLLGLRSRNIWGAFRQVSIHFTPCYREHFCSFVINYNALGKQENIRILRPWIHTITYPGSMNKEIVDKTIQTGSISR